MAVHSGLVLCLSLHSLDLLKSLFKVLLRDEEVLLLVDLLGLCLLQLRLQVFDRIVGLLELLVGLLERHLELVFLRHDLLVLCA